MSTRALPSPLSLTEREAMLRAIAALAAQMRAGKITRAKAVATLRQPPYRCANDERAETLLNAAP